MNFNLVEMYNGLLRFNKHILNELAEGLKHLPNLDGVSKGDSLIINEQGNPAWGSAAFIPTFENAAYGIEWTKDDNDIIRIGNAIMNVVKDIWTKSFIHNTYSCIEGRGIHLCANNLKRDLRKYYNETKYCLKLDIRKFYPSIPHDGLRNVLERRLKIKIF